jgi:hypothetical protein
VIAPFAHPGRGGKSLRADAVAGLRAASVPPIVNHGSGRVSSAKIGNRAPRGGPVHYTDVDLALRVDADGRPTHTHNDGTPY